MLSVWRKLIATIMGCWFCMHGNLSSAYEKVHWVSNGEFIRKLLRHTHHLEEEIGFLQNKIETLSPAPRRNFLPNQPDMNIVGTERPIFIVGTPVISSPYLGVNSAYNASDLVVNQPYVNEDLYLLQQQRQIFAYFKTHCYPIPDTPVIDLSGKIEAQVFHTNHYNNFQNISATDINLSAIELDTEVLVNQWTTGLMAFVYDDSLPSMSPRRIDNSNVFLERGFLTFGNLAEFPLYATIGQFYVPFGQYASDMLSDPFTKTLGRTKARAIAFGFSEQFNCENNLNVATFVFRGPSRTSLKNRGLRNYGANADYTFTKPNWSIDVAASYIRSIADSLGMQHNGNIALPGNFEGFATNDMTEVFNPVSGLDGRAVFTIGCFSLTGEYVTANHSFSEPVMSFNQKGAKPQALHFEAAYKFNLLNKPTAFVIGYDESSEALGFLVPKKRYIAVLSASLLKDTIESLEFRHDTDYSSTDIAVGQLLNPIQGTGKNSNTLTLQVGLYF